MCIRDRRRATSKKRAAEAEKELNMDDKEATPVEDVEEILERVERKKPAPPEEQPEIHTQTGDVHVQDKEVEKPKTTEESKMDKLMEMFMQMKKDMEENSKKMEKKMDSTKEENSKERKDCLLYTSHTLLYMHSHTG